LVEVQLVVLAADELFAVVGFSTRGRSVVHEVGGD
jgi:hypothetical protein